MRHIRTRRGVGALALVLAATTAVTGCTAGGGTTAAEDEETTLTVLTVDTALGLDPATNVNFPTTWLGLIGRRLTTWEVGDGGTAEVVPDLATDTGTPNEDGTVWTYTLKDDVFFQDGTPITSADIKYGVERTFVPDLAGGLTYHQSLLEGAEGYEGPFDGEHLDSIETPDDKTIVFRLNTAYGDWPWLAAMNAFIPVPEGEGTDTAEYDLMPVASGPYQVESNEAGSETVFVRNEHWDAATDEVRTADADRIVFQQSQNASTIAQSLIADTGDAKTSFTATPLSAAELALVGADPAASERLVTSDSGLLFYTAMNADSDELSDPLVREAVQYAVDRDAIVLARGGTEAATPATTMITPGVPGYEDFDLYPEDVDRAKELLAEAGYADGVELDLWVANEDVDAAEAMQSGLARADITVNIVPMDIGAMYGEAMGGGDPDYDLFLSYWIPDYPSANGSLSLLFDSAGIDGGYNLARLDDPAVDTAIADAIATTDPDAAAAAWGAIDRQVMTASAAVPLYVTRNSFLAGSEVTDVQVGDFPPYQNYLKVGVAE